MNIILVSDVFGITPALLKLKDELGANAIVDPYNAKCMGFDNENEAYACFVTNVGLDNYVAILIKALEAFDADVTLIGFSIGASALWRLSLNHNNGYIKQAICFYGSQIRNLTQIEPCFNVTLIFPKSELHFNVTNLIEKLTIKPKVEVTQVEYLHGFMNYYSTNFNQIGYDKHVSLLRSMIKKCKWSVIV
jgi:dienelactone hydrolase